MNKPSPDSRQHEKSVGFTKIGTDGFRNEGLYVPVLREKELARFLEVTREAAREAFQKADEARALMEVKIANEQAREANEVTRAEGCEKGEGAEKGEGGERGEGLCPVPAVDSDVSVAVDLQVPCVFEVDVLAQKASAEGNLKFSERDRTNAVKAVTKALLARPMTRRIGVPKDVETAIQQLGEVAPHIPELLNALQIPLLVSRASGAPPLISPILLVGPAGVGKSYVALQVAKILGVPLHVLSYAASGSAGNVLSGSDKNWGNSSTGMVFDALSGGEFANPVICLDEIDKASISGSSQGSDRNPLNELLALLEPVTACAHKDRCAEIRVDARHIVWMATANSLQGLSAPLLSRFQLVMVHKPDARAAVMIALSVTQAVSSQLGVAVKPPSGDVLQFLATLTPRTIRRIWMGAAGWCAANGGDRVSIRDIEQSLGLRAGDAIRLH